MCVYALLACLWLVKVRRGVGSLGTGAAGNHELPCGAEN